MSVPLERLYNFLHDVCNHDDIVIYRFFPHGSRKIEDLKRSIPKVSIQLDNWATPINDIIHKKFMFVHDQEPLNFDLYSSSDLIDKIHYANLDNKSNKIMDEFLINLLKELITKIMPELNLKIVEGAGLWKIPVLLTHSEKRSKNLIQYENINFIGVYWWCHAAIARDWFRYAEHDPLLDKKVPFKDFLVYNRAWEGTREYRLKFAELLINYQLTDHCLMGFNKEDGGKNYLEHQYQNSKLQIQRQDLEQYFFYNTSTSSASADYVSVDYQSTKIEIVLETLFDDDRLHLTEKTLRPIACGQPFILASTVGSLEYLRSYGFETFEPWINESYDQIEDPVERLEAIVREMQRISNLDAEEKTILYNHLKNIASRNKNLFFSKEWQDKIVNEYQQNYQTGINELDRRRQKLISLF